MAIVVKDPGASATKWSQRASAAAQSYTQGVASSTKDQAGLAAAAAPLWAAAVAAAAQSGTFAKKVIKAGTQAWQAGVASKGATRYGPGVNAATSKYQTAVTPFFAAIASVVLPAKGVKGSNIGRVDAVDQALIKAKAAQ